MQNFIKILYLLLTIFEQSTKITHSRLFIPNLTLEKIFPRTKLFRPELNRKKKVPLAFQIKKKKNYHKITEYIPYIQQNARHHDSHRNATKFHQVPHLPRPVYQVSKLHELTYPLRLNPRTTHLPPRAPFLSLLRNVGA